MQTEAEKYLIRIIKKLLTLSTKTLTLINLGAAKSTVIEDDLLKSGLNFICDRSDINDCEVDKSYVKRNYVCSLEDMKVIGENSYDIAFANFVMEHILDIEKMAQEAARIVTEDGNFVISLPNPQAPEFKFAKATSTSFHQLFRKKGYNNAYPVNYAYKTIDNFVSIMEQNGWKLQEKKYFPATYSYLYRYPLINLFSYIYDKAIASLAIKALLGHTVLHFRLSIKGNNHE